jgi:Phosphate-induced protein 1 conserved region
LKRTVRPLLLLPLLSCVMLVMAFMGPLSANATTVHSTHAATTRQHSPKPRGSNLSYHGGPVMAGTTNVYAIFWEPTGSYVSPTYNSLITRYFKDVGGSTLYHNNTQYTQNGGSFPSNAVFAASWVDTQKYPSSTLQDSNIQSEVTHAQNANGWTSNLNNVFFVFTARGENICAFGVCSFSYFCAYHNNFGSTLYAAMPYTGTNLAACGVTHSPNGDVDADSTINVTSHEQMEAATDPQGTAWYDRNGNEIGDKCAWIFGSLNGQGGDVSWNGDAYYVQKEWDNHVSGCVLSGP